MSDTPRGFSTKIGIKSGPSSTATATSRPPNINGANPGSSGSKKKKKGGRKRKENEIYKATDTIINAENQLASILFQKASYVVKIVARKGRTKPHPVSHHQFEDAAEAVDPLLRQNRADSLGVGRPPFGYYSLHPSTLMLHPPHAVHHYYPATPMMFNAWMRSPPLTSNVASNHSQPQLHHSNNLLHHHQHSVSPKIPPRSVSQHHSGVLNLSPQQQVQSPAHSQAHGVAPGFLEFAKRRQQEQQEQLRQQEAYKLQQESLHQEQLRQNHTLAQLQSQQQRHRQASPREKRRIEHLQQQQESTAAVLASMRTQTPALTPQTAAAAHAAQMKLIPRGHTDPTGEGLQPEQDAGMRIPARMALEASRKDPATAAKYLSQLASVKEGQLYPAAASISHPQQQRSPPQEQLKSSSIPPRQQPRPVAATASEDYSLDENSAGAKQFVKRMITTSADSALTTGMDRLETLPMLSYTPPDTKKEFPVREQEITNCDVLVRHCQMLFLCTYIHRTVLSNSTYDFLKLGRGGMTNHHAGNQSFRVLVGSFRLHYCAAKKGDKGKLSKKLTNFVRHKDGRFLQKEEMDNLWVRLLRMIALIGVYVLDPGDKSHIVLSLRKYEVGDNRAHGKCAQALREGTADLNRQVASGVLVDQSVGDSDMATYPKAYAVRATSGTVSSTGASSSRYTSDTAMHNQSTTPTTARAVPSQLASVPGDQSSPRCVIVRQGDVTPKSQSGPGHSPVEEERARQSPKRPVSKIQSNGQARTSPSVVPSQSIRPAVTTDDMGPNSVERPTIEQPKSNDAIRSDDEEGSTTKDEQVEVTSEEEARRKRMKVEQPAEDHFDYI